MNQVSDLDLEAHMQLQLASLTMKLQRVPAGFARFDAVYQHNQSPQAADNCDIEIRDGFQSLGTMSRTESTHLSVGNMSQAESNDSFEGLEAPLLSDLGPIHNSNRYNHALKETKLEQAAAEPLKVVPLHCKTDSNSQASLQAILKKYPC
jgi:hypothetical protein